MGTHTSWFIRGVACQAAADMIAKQHFGSCPDFHALQVRAADKFCVDVMCILMLLGLCAILYAIIKNGVKL